MTIIFVYSTLNSFNSYDLNVAVYTGLGLVKQVVIGFGIASNDTGQLYIKHFDFFGSPPQRKVFCSCVYFVLMTENQQTAHRAVMWGCTVV